MRARPSNAFLLCVIVSLVLGYAISGHYLGHSLIGLDPSAFPAGELLQSIATAMSPGLNRAIGGIVIAIGLIAGLGVSSFFFVRSSRRRQVLSADPSRRGFLTGSLAGAGAGAAAVLAGGGAMLGRAWLGFGNGGRGWDDTFTKIFGGDVVKTNPEWKSEWKGSKVQAYGRLGRTEWKVSDTVLGTGQLKGDLGERVARLAIERGVNYIDTAPDYAGSGSEQAVGRAIKDVPREQLFIATKFCSTIGHLPPGTPVARYKEVVEESLGRLSTDYVDLIHVHSCDELDRLMDPNMHEAFEQLKREGKVRFLGFSTHTPNLMEVANAAIDSGKFDVMMLAYHHGIWPEIEKVIERARREQDMGVVAMKTLKGARHHGLEGFRDDADSYAQAALKWVHSDPNVSCAVISFFELQHVDEYLHASGKRPNAEDLAVLERYDRAIVGTYCTPHCGVCLDSCPEGVAIDDVLRHRMYFEDYRSEAEAMRRYARLERDASPCLGCSAPCAGSCPYGIDIQSRTIGAHEMLKLEVS